MTRAGLAAADFGQRRYIFNKLRQAVWSFNEEDMDAALLPDQMPPMLESKSPVIRGLAEEYARESICPTCGKVWSSVESGAHSQFDSQLSSGSAASSLDSLHIVARNVMPLTRHTVSMSATFGVD